MSDSEAIKSYVSKVTNAIDEIRNNAGSQFDPVLAEAFQRLDLTFYDELVARHQRDAGAGKRGSLRREGQSGIVARVGRDGAGGGQAA